MIPHASRSVSLATVLTLLTLAVGCTSYRTPGGPAPIGEMTAASVAARLRSAPETPLPAIIAFTRVQESGYRSWNDGGVDRGPLSLVGPREIEREPDARAIAGWAEVRDVVRLTPILVRAQADSLLALREGAASLHADVLAIYTVDTVFDIDSHDIGPIGLITLGLAPTEQARVRTSVSMALFDVRTGHCFGTAEGTASDDQLANAWTSSDAVDQCRLRVERKAFEAMLDEARKTWEGAASIRRAALVGEPAKPR